MKIMKDGIAKSINKKDLGYYLQRGWKKIGCSEPQPSQTELYIVDDYTIAKRDKV